MRSASLFSLLLIFLYSCTGDQKGVKRTLPDMLGPWGEVVVIMKKNQWNGDMGTAVREVFSREHPHLFPSESFLDLSSSNFENLGRLQRQRRNIILCKVSDTVKSPQHKYYSEVWAEGQFLIEISAKSENEFGLYLREKAREISGSINHKELERINRHNRLDKKRNTALEKGILAKHNIKLKIPTKFRKGNTGKEEEDFTWFLRRKTQLKGGLGHEIRQEVLVYHLPYTDTSELSQVAIIARRDSVLKKYIHGPKKGSYLGTTLDERFYPQSSVNSFNDYTRELNGFWETIDGTPMGGVFKSITTVDRKRGRILCVDAYLYCPQIAKREHLRELEALVYSLEMD